MIFNNSHKIVSFKIFIIVIFCFNSMLTAANIKISGMVKDSEANKALAGVNIIVKGTKRGASSGLNGKYEIILPANKKYIIEAMMMGYETQLKTIIPQADMTVDFELYPTILKTQAVTVIGERQRNLIEKPMMESPALKLSSTIVSRKVMSK
ncbi:carboxypeptidase-like regulatory domain-containing protein, partial [bacterium]|nr:carboxypeptidase-like regulatory domain-containing protein [bacterium]